MAEPALVLEGEVRGVVEVDVRLRGAVEQQRPGRAAGPRSGTSSASPPSTGSATAQGAAPGPLRRARALARRPLAHALATLRRTAGARLAGCERPGRVTAAAASTAHRQRSAASISAGRLAERRPQHRRVGGQVRVVRAAAASPVPLDRRLGGADAQAAARRSAYRRCPACPSRPRCRAAPGSRGCRRRRRAAPGRPPSPRRAAGCPPPPGPDGPAPSPGRSPGAAEHWLVLRDCAERRPRADWSPSRLHSNRDPPRRVGHDRVSDRVQRVDGVNGYGGMPPQRMAVHGRSRARYPFCSQTPRGGPVTAGTFLPAGTRDSTVDRMVRRSQRGPGHGVVNGASSSPPPRPNPAFRQLRGQRSPAEFAAAVRRAAREIGEQVSLRRPLHRPRRGGRDPLPQLRLRAGVPAHVPRPHADRPGLRAPRGGPRTRRARYGPAAVPDAGTVTAAVRAV